METDTINNTLQDLYTITEGIKKEVLQKILEIGETDGDGLLSALAEHPEATAFCFGEDICSLLEAWNSTLATSCLLGDYQVEDEEEDDDEKALTEDDFIQAGIDGREALKRGRVIHIDPSANVDEEFNF